MRKRITSSTRVFALLGDPVAHSLSPVIQNAAFSAARVNGVYIALRCGREDMEGLVRSLARSGGGGNITLPHKERAAAVVDHSGEAVRRTGACNTFWQDEEGRIFGDNTDTEGFARAVKVFLGCPPEGFRVLLLGAGGAARATLVGLLDEGVSEVTLYNRTTERARAVARRIGGSRVRVAPVINELEGGNFDLVVNATRLGLDPADPLPLDLSLLERAPAVMDLVYAQQDTPFVAAARANGARVVDGREMLLQQGAVAFERWWGQEAPIDAMRKALETAISR